MTGKIVVLLIVFSSLIAGAGLYYLQVYYYYAPVTVEGKKLQLTAVASGQPETIIANDIEAIDATSSPIRFRACFTTPMSHALLSETYEMRDDAVPLTAPGWFGCFDADEIGDALADGRALAFTGENNIAYGVDRVFAIFDDGRGFVWHQLNNCGERAYDGSAVGPECPPIEDFQNGKSESN
ncbi:MAG: histidine kinase [Paracoccaceae bacterium]